MRIKKAGFLTKIVILALLIYMATSLLELRGQIQAHQEQQEQLNAQVTAQAEENARLADAIENSDDPDMLQAVARDKGFVLPGETLIVDVSK